MTRDHATPDIIISDHGEVWTKYTGTKEALVAAGIVPKSGFPTGRKRKKWNMGPDVPREKEYRTERAKGGKYTVTRWHYDGVLPYLPPGYDGNVVFMKAVKRERYSRHVEEMLDLLDDIKCRVKSGESVGLAFLEFDEEGNYDHNHGGRFSEQSFAHACCALTCSILGVSQEE